MKRTIKPLGHVINLVSVTIYFIIHVFINLNNKGYDINGYYSLNEILSVCGKPFVIAIFIASVLIWIMPYTIFGKLIPETLQDYEKITDISNEE